LLSLRQDFKWACPGLFQEGSQVYSFHKTSQEESQMLLSTPEGRQDRSEQLVRRLQEILQRETFGEVLDYGTGSGPVTFALQPYAKRVIAADKSAQVVKDIEKSAREQSLSNIQGFVLDLEKDAPPEDLQVDLAVCVMALHHIEDIPRVLEGFTSLLRPGGALALADLDIEDGSFHAEGASYVRKGLDRQWLLELLEGQGLEGLTSETVYVIRREHEGGAREYPIFLITARKPR
jgi:SAM-dependent methyltransferase